MPYHSVTYIVSPFYFDIKSIQKNRNFFFTTAKQHEIINLTFYNILSVTLTCISKKYCTKIIF